MIDQAEILADVLRRNKLRIDNKLPPFDVRTEFEFQIALAADRAFRANLPEYMVKHEADRLRLREQVIEELKQKDGPAATDGPRGHYIIRRGRRPDHGRGASGACSGLPCCC